MTIENDGATFAGRKNLECKIKVRPGGRSVVPEGTRVYLLLHPPLKWWAKIFRPFGAGFAAGLSVPQTLLASAVDPAIDPYEPRSNFLAFGTSLNRCAALHPDVRVLGAGVVITTAQPEARRRICFGWTVRVRVAGSLLTAVSLGACSWSRRFPYGLLPPAPGGADR